MNIMPVSCIIVSGDLAAMLAKKGAMAERDILESQYGFLNLF